jgi:nucleotide-binding universal stress UspA family protein
MGAHARGLLRRIFTRDTSRELLHKAPCPVWFVPEIAAA